MMAPNMIESNSHISVLRIHTVILPRILSMAMFMRIFMILFMAISDWAIIDHNAGIDVVTYDLDLPSAPSKMCVIDHSLIDLKNECPSDFNYFKDSWFHFMLRPMTKWDAARFLHLAAHEHIRDPTKLDDKTNVSSLVSEQAHAFFPLYPILVRYGAKQLIQILPVNTLPSSNEAVLVVSAALWNSICFFIALISLADLTLRLMLPNEYAIQTTFIVATLFCFNPASIFFATSYSESLFAACTFLGYALYTAGYSYLAIMPWMAASYTRSNGSIVAGWLLMQGIAAGIPTHDNSTERVCHRVSQTIWHIILAIAVLIPIRVHDHQGWSRHCGTSFPPDWCFEKITSLYAYVQKKHWNVGFLKYYKLKQIPNFLLAAPIIISSFNGVQTWIQANWRACGSDCKFQLRHIQKWVLHALRESCDGTSQTLSIFHDPKMLSHYVALAAVALFGILVAHVQINTRMICSTCPAIYWHTAYLCQKGGKFLNISIKLLIGVYLAVFIVIGTVLHVNFLPWT
jgi:GPI mannosyltransferase 2